MTLPGVDHLLQEVSPGWRRAGYAALLAAFIVTCYFVFVSGRIADAMELAQQNSHRIDTVDTDIKDIKGTVEDLRERQAANAQKLQDVKESVDSINSKLDRLLMQRRAQYP
jgi:septal ring factor EnvC (AmiA/AmiB activator)